jgi:hypothetical protein
MQAGGANQTFDEQGLAYSKALAVTLKFLFFGCVARSSQSLT